MNRRTFLEIGLSSAGVAALSSARSAGQTLEARHPLWPLWETWQERHLDYAGRVVDATQRGASHSEGQGCGMLLAAEFGDRDAFRRMFDWTEANLAIRADKLLAWRWLSDVPERVPDLNNASDGDLFYAWALVRAAERFGETRLRDRAAGLAADLARKCAVARPDRPGRPILLPAEYGFVEGDTIVVNPSYIMPRALREVAAATGQPVLAQVADEGLSLMRDIAASRLVPDWLRIGPEGLSPARGFSSDAGYEAIRVPLFLAWSGEASHPALRRAAAAFGQAPRGYAATIVDAETGQVLSLSGDAGYRAVAALATCVAQDRHGAAIPPFRSSDPYYPATLHMFALLTQFLHYPRCVPI